MSTARHHAEWLSLIEVSGPFLSMPVLLRVFPQGLDAHDSEVARNLRLAYEEWRDSQGGLSPDPAIHTAWLRFVLSSVLDLGGELLREGPAIPEAIKATFAEHGETLRPDLLVQRVERGEPPRMLVQLVKAGQYLDGALMGQRWKASPATRMAELLRASDVRLGLVTNGERWMLVHAPRGETASFISWYAEVWLDEPLTLRAFRSLLGIQRFFGVADADMLEALLAESAANQQEVTDQLGYQVREAVEVLVQSLDRIDKDRGRALLAGVSEAQLYESALTVMMRLVFLFSAEERGLLRLGDPIYDQYYAVSTLRGTLREAADQHGEEVLERRNDAWSRLLATFRAVHGGIAHEALRLPAYGGHLFDPDRYPFLEGRPQGSRWRETPAHPLPVDNRTVLHLLEALQILQIRVPGGGAEPRRLSFRALDIEQIGHVYEGLLDHTAVRANEPILGLSGSKDLEPEIALATLEQVAVSNQLLGFSQQLPLDDGVDRPQSQTTTVGQLNANSSQLIAFLREATGRSEKALTNALNAKLDQRFLDTLRAACDNDAALFARVRPFAGLLRRDSFDRPVVVNGGSVYVTTGSDRRSTGTHYTPRSLTEPIVQHTLDPLVYHGPAEGLPQAEWKLHPAEQILALKLCDMALGSGAFLVQACRYLAAKLVEAAEGRAPDSSPDEALNQLFALRDDDEKLAQARRLVADRCLYGVDKNPLAVEMAKLSLWLITLQKDRPFTFLDHALRPGDSLLGLSSVEQLTRWSLGLREEDRKLDWVTGPLERALREAYALRRRLESFEVRDVRHAEAKAQLLREAERAMATLRLGADLLVAAALAPDPKAREERRLFFLQRYALLLRAEAEGRPADELRAELQGEAERLLHGRKPFHWPLELPEVFAEEGAGFAAIVGNPPFLGGKRISTILGESYERYLKTIITRTKGSADLCAYFFLQAGSALQRNGHLSLLATNTIAQGDTREVGLDKLVQAGFSIPRAVSSRSWPGNAAVEVAHIYLRRGDWQGSAILDEKPVVAISPYLTEPGKAEGKPERLAANVGKAFIGSYVLGRGFVLEPEQAEALMTQDPRNKNVLYPFLNGEDLNSRPNQSSSRWVINFFDWSYEQAATYPECLQILTTHVKPERDAIVARGKQIHEYDYWKFWDKRLDKYQMLEGLTRVIVVAATSRTLGFAFAPIDIVFSHAVCVFADDRASNFAVLQSAFHETWSRELASSMKGDLRYAPSDIHDTFPFPEATSQQPTANNQQPTTNSQQPTANSQQLNAIGETYHQHRQAVMTQRNEGLTKTYNRFHDQGETSADIAELRRLHVAMDQAVARAYGWDDLDLGHGFHQTKQGLRYTISEAARREVLDRLLALNHARYAEEVAAGLHDKGAKKGKGGRKARGSVAEQGELF